MPAAAQTSHTSWLLPRAPVKSHQATPSGWCHSHWPWQRRREAGTLRLGIWQGVPSGAEGTSPARVPREMGGVIEPTCREAQTGWFSEQKASGKPAATHRQRQAQQPPGRLVWSWGGSLPEFGSRLGLHCWVTFVNSVTSRSLPFPVCTLVVELLTSWGGRGS